MKHIFYFMTIFPLLWELIGITNVQRVHNFSKGIKALKGKKFDEYSSMQKNVSVLMMLYILWTFIGLFSSQWLTFSVLLGISLIPKRFIVLRWIDSVISFALLLFIILNAYHFKIDLLSYAQMLWHWL